MDGQRTSITKGLVDLEKLQIVPPDLEFSMCGQREMERESMCVLVCKYWQWRAGYLQPIEIQIRKEYP